VGYPSLIKGDLTYKNMKNYPKMPIDLNKTDKTGELTAAVTIN